LGLSPGVIVKEGNNIAYGMLDTSISGAGQTFLEYVWNHLKVWILGREAIK